MKCAYCKTEFTEESTIKLFEEESYHDLCLATYKKETIVKYPYKCPECGGKGKVYKPYHDMFGAEVWGEDIPCTFCNGEGRLKKEPKKVPTQWKWVRGD